MTSLQNGVKILPKISIAWVGSTNVTDRQTDDRRQTTDRRQTDGRWHIANMNLSSRSLKICMQKTQNTQHKQNKSMHSEMGPVWQNLIQRTVRTAHQSMFMTVHNFTTQYNWHKLTQKMCKSCVQYFCIFGTEFSLPSFALRAMF